MKISGKFEQILWFMLTAFVLVFCAGMARIGDTNSFAEGETISFASSEHRFVTIYDNGRKLIVRTDAETVGEALKRADITMNQGDKVEPSLETEINANDYFINIYRARPVIIKDGVKEKYFMTASYDAKEIAREAGFTIYDDDEINVKVNQNFLEAGAANLYDIQRNGGRDITVEEEIAFSEQTEKDYNLAPGVREVRQLGEVGLKKTYYKVLYVDNKEVSRELIREEVVREPVARIVAVGVSAIERKPLTASMGRNRYTVTLSNGRVVERQETYYDLPMKGVMGFCGGGTYHVREDGVKVDQDGYVLVAAELSRYPRCSVVETSLGLGKVYDTGTFAITNPEQFDLATDWTNRNGV